jgi:hypothetical protein
MDPLAVIRTIWRMKWFALPAIFLTIAAAAGVYLYGPRTYESSISYALVNPKIPSEEDIKLDPALGELNSDNPYLRSSDPNLIANVVITRLNAPGTADYLKQRGLGTEFLAAPGAGGAGLIVSITASGDTEVQSIATIHELGAMFEQNLRDVQSVNGADERFLFTSIVVAEPDRATEKLSSRIRTVIMVALAGVVLIFGAVSLGTWVESSRARRRQRRSDEADAAPAAQPPVDPAETDPVDSEPAPVPPVAPPAQSDSPRRSSATRVRRGRSSATR